MPLKDDEIRFFIACYTYGRTSFNRPIIRRYSNDYLLPRDIVHILTGYVPHKRCWYYLKKWSELGFYDYGVTLDLGWFYTEKLPERYKKLLEETK